MRNPCFFLCVVLLAPIGCSPPKPAAPEPATKETVATSATRPAATRAADDDQSSEQKLIGTWIAKDVDAKMGEVKIKLTFRHDGPMKLAAWSDIPFAGQVRDKKGPYEVNGNVISSPAIRGGTSVEFWFERGDLLIKYKEGKTVRFHRA